MKEVMKESEGNGEGLNVNVTDSLEHQLELTDDNLLFLPSGKMVDIKWILYKVSGYTRSVRYGPRFPASC